MRGGHLKVDNIPKLRAFAEAFQLDKKAYEQYKTKKQQVDPPVVPAGTMDNTAFVLALRKYFVNFLRSSISGQRKINGNPHLDLPFNLRRIQNTHWASDLGAADFARELAEEVKSPLLLSQVSRLLIDVNRPVESDTLCREVADGKPIHLNKGKRVLSESEGFKIFLKLNEAIASRHSMNPITRPFEKWSKVLAQLSCWPFTGSNPNHSVDSFVVLHHSMRVKSVK